MADAASNLFEIQRRAMYWNKLTTLDDGVTALTWDANPNDAVDGNTPGESKLVQILPGSFYFESYGQLWHKTSMPNTWKAISSTEGATGPDTGQTGVQGATGIQGHTGLIGFTGVQGDTGSLGVTGLGTTGPRGFTGILGGVGTAGETGAQGETGYGATGLSGVTGVQGETGLGYTGVAGATGVQGNTGTAGGETGVQGATGPDGSLIVGLSCPTGVLIHDLVYISGDNFVDRANATSISTGRPMGFVVDKPTTTLCAVKTHGILDGFLSLTSGSAYFLDVLDGCAIAIAPTSSGSIVAPVGTALSTTKMSINISGYIMIRS